MSAFRERPYPAPWFGSILPLKTRLIKASDFAACGSDSPVSLDSCRTSQLSRNRQHMNGASFFPLPFRADWVKMTVGASPVFWPRPKDAPYG